MMFFKRFAKKTKMSGVAERGIKRELSDTEIASLAGGNLLVCPAGWRVTYHDGRVWCSR